MQFILVLHILFVGAWFGCVAVEFLLETAPKKIVSLRETVPLLHYNIDRYIEMPLVLGVLLTGSLQINTARLSGLYLLKMLAGLIAVSANLLCWFPVRKRKMAAAKKDGAEVKRQSLMILRLTQVGMPAALLALICAGLLSS